MANRQARRAREMARREEESRMRRLLRVQKQTEHIDLTRTELHQLARVCYVWHALSPSCRNERTQTVCAVFQWLQRQQPSGMVEVYHDAETLMADVLRLRAGRMAILYGDGYLKRILAAAKMVRTLKNWSPHRGRNLNKLMAGLAEEWCGAYRHQLAPVVRRQLRYYLGQPVKMLSGWGWEVVMDQLQGYPVHKSSVSRHLPVLPAAQIALRRVPKQMRSLEAVITAANLLAKGTPRRIVRVLSNDLWYYLKDERMMQSPIWQLLAEHPNLRHHELYHWFWEAYDWNGREASLALKPSYTASYHVLGYMLTRRPKDESDSERNLWYAFCLDQLQRQGKKFRLLGRNEKRLEKKFQTYRLKHLQTLRDAEPEWAASSFATWEQEGQNGVYRIEELRSASALQLEGLLMQHCVETYVASCRKQLCSIWSLRWYPKDGECISLVTIELSPQGQLRQAYAKCNIKPKPEWRSMITSWRATF